MTHHIKKQHRFILESKERVTIRYQVDFTDPNEPKIVFSGYPLTENSNFNQLNRFIGFYLNEQIVNTVGNHQHQPPTYIINKTANIKFKIPCVGYFNDGDYNTNDNNNVLPEFFIKHIQPTPDSAFNVDRNINSTLDMDYNLLVNCNLNVYNDITAFATYHSSDINLKKNINTLTNCYDVVSDLNPVGFKWIKNNKDNVGFIAQEVEQIIPNIVSNIDEYKAIAETKIIAYLVGAIQELDKELKELEAE
tara:strand:- start:9693 stop:10439 length:747 start_codon:yes stop_codon:yes gene_type:complete